MLHDAGLATALTSPVIVGLGLAEVLFAAALLIFWHRTWPPLLCLAFAVVATVVVAITSPGYLGAAFNPVTLNLAVGCLAVIDLLTLDGLPSADRCVRHPRREGA